MRGLVLTVIACSVCLNAQTMCQAPSPDWLLPSEENYQPEYEAHKTGDTFQRLHTLRLGDRESNRYVSIGGQERQWYESFSTPPLGNGPADSNGYLLQRYMLHFDAHLSDRIRVFVEFKGDLENGRVGGPRPDVDEDRGDFNQAFLEITLLKRRHGKLSVRAGRQELVLGSGRLVDMREGPNVRRGFDGARLTYCADRWRLDAFAARPVVNKAGAFDDVPAHQTAFAGVYATRSTPRFFGGNVDLYYFAFDQKQSLYARGAAHEQRHTLGSRFWRFGDGWDYDVELLDQFGRFGANGIQAWGVSVNTGYTFTARWKPRFGVKTGIASGDGGAGTSENGTGVQNGNDLGTLNPLFASLHYFGEEGLAGPANFADLRPEFTAHPLRNVSVTLSSDWFWRHRLTDGIYLPGPILLVRPNGSQARYIGNQSAVELGWDPSPHWTTAVYFSHFLNGDFLNQATKSHNLDYVAGWVSFHF